MNLRIFQVDAFASQVFAGNPAAVVPLDRWLPDEVLQAIALENNLSETAFFVPAADADDADYHLRWFTPALEVDLCGHATLATAHVLASHLGTNSWPVRFKTKSGIVQVSREHGRLVLDFPARPAERLPDSSDVAEALGRAPLELHAARDLMAVFGSEEEVRSLAADMTRVAALDTFAVIVTAPGAARDVDFVSRFFTPRGGIPEDPVTGSAHCTLVPYWAARLGKRDLRAFQVSPRGGELFCRHEPERGRVRIAGRAVTYLEGTIQCPCSRG